MALIMYISRAPRYEGITMEDIKLMDSYFAWQQENAIGGKYRCDTFEEWCHHSESELPTKEIINYFKPSWVLKTKHNEGFGATRVYSIIDFLGRFIRANPIYNWLYNNVLDNKLDKKYYEISKEQLTTLLNSCREVAKGITLIAKCDKKKTFMNQYAVDEKIAKHFLPTQTEQGAFFGPTEYDSFYATQILNAIDIISNVLNTTDFEKQTVYVNFFASM